MMFVNKSYKRSVGYKMLDRFKVRMWDKDANKMWFFENDFLLETVFECLKQQLANDSKEPKLSPMAYDHIKDGRVFMQCTGLKDTNDTLIYEDDLVRDEYGELFRVIWCYNAWELKPINDNIRYTLGLIGEELEVVRNIHQNADLIK